MNETVVEGLLVRAIQALVNVININSAFISPERIARINDNRINLENYFEIIIETVNELAANSEN